MASCGIQATPSATVRCGAGTTNSNTSAATATPAHTPTARRRCLRSCGLASTCFSALATGTTAIAATAQIASSTPTKKNCPAMKSAMATVTNRR